MREAILVLVVVGDGPLPQSSWTFPSEDLEGSCSSRCSTIPKGERMSGVCLLRRAAWPLIAMMIAVGPRPVAAEPEVSCGWCVEVSDGLGNTQHGFPNGADRCAGAAPSWGSSASCARCGGSSDCHGFNVPSSSGSCHIACGGSNLVAVQSRIAELLRAGETSELARMIHQPPVGVSVLFSSSGGRIEVVADCSPDRVAALFIVPDRLRSALHPA